MIITTITPAPAPAPPRIRIDTRPLMAWIICWIVLPNAGFWLLWVVGAPPRHIEIFVTGVIGLLLRDSGFWVRLTAFIGLFTYSILSFVSALFNLSIVSLLASLKFVAELQPGASPEYLAVAAALSVTLFVAVRCLRWRSDFTGVTTLLIAMAAILATSALDVWMSQGMRGMYKRTAPDGAPFDSAVGASGFAANPAVGASGFAANPAVGASGFAANPAAKRHLVMVMVESMGLPSDPVLRQRLFARWRQSDIAARYSVSEGSAPYFGSTTSGEIRELCGRWGDYYDLVDRADAACLPAQLQAKGYQTTAMHSFDGGFFAREKWYPNIGFADSVFGRALMDMGAKGCPGVFPGACDRDVPRSIGAQLRAGGDQPQFIYWLTVNSHLPVIEGESLGTTACDTRESAELRRFAMICRQYQLWDQMNEGLARELLRADLADADILIVGDHMPPYFDRAQRSQFAPDRVPWVLLRAKGQSVLAAR